MRLLWRSREDVPPAAESPGSYDGSRYLSLDALQAAYTALMAAYADVLAQAAQASRRRAGETLAEFTSRVQGTPQARGGAFKPPLLRLFVGAHVRRRLDVLVARFAQLEAALPPRAAARRRDWMRQAREDAERIAESLPSLRIPGLFALIPAAAGLASIGGEGWSVGLDPAIWAGIGGFAAFTGLVAFRDAWLAFRAKRELFLPGASEIDRWPAEKQRSVTGQNYYRLEDELFYRLGTRHSPEAALDGVIAFLTFFTAAELLFLAPAVLNLPDAAAWLGLGAGFVLLIVNVIVANRVEKRIWR